MSKPRLRAVDANYFVVPLIVFLGLLSIPIWIALGVTSMVWISIAVVIAATIMGLVSLTVLLRARRAIRDVEVGPNVYVVQPLAATGTPFTLPGTIATARGDAAGLAVFDRNGTRMWGTEWHDIRSVELGYTGNRFTSIVAPGHQMPLAVVTLEDGTALRFHVLSDSGMYESPWPAIKSWEALRVAARVG